MLAGIQGSKSIGDSLTKGKQYSSLNGIFKSDSSTSLNDIPISAPIKSKHLKRSKNQVHNDDTVMPLLGAAGINEMAALVPEEKSQDHQSVTEMQSDTKSSSIKREITYYPLRFPLLSPSRGETLLFFRMKNLRRAAKFTGRHSFSEGLDSQEQVEFTGEKGPLSPLGNDASPPSRGSKVFTRDTGRSSVQLELEKVPATQERLEQLRTAENVCQVPYERRNKVGKLKKKGKGKKPKILVPSKYGYHTRSNSATYKRLNKVRLKMDTLLEEQISKVIAEHSDLSETESGSDLDTDEEYDSRSISGSLSDRTHLRFNLDSNIYRAVKDTKDLSVLYKNNQKSADTNKSHKSSAKSLTIVLPKIEREHTADIATDRTDRGRSITPRTQTIEEIPRVQIMESKNILHYERSNSSSEHQVPLSLESLANPDLKRFSISSGILPDIQRAVSIDNSQPTSPFKKHGAHKKSRSKNKAEASNFSEMSFLVDDSKSITPSSPSKTYRDRQRSRQSNGSPSKVESRNRSRVSSRRSNHHDQIHEENQFNNEIRSTNKSKLSDKNLEDVIRENAVENIITESNSNLNSRQTSIPEATEQAINSPNLPNKTAENQIDSMLKDNNVSEDKSRDKKSMKSRDALSSLGMNEDSEDGWQDDFENI